MFKKLTKSTVTIEEIAQEVGFRESAKTRSIARSSVSKWRIPLAVMSWALAILLFWPFSRWTDFVMFGLIVVPQLATFSIVGSWELIVDAHSIRVRKGGPKHWLLKLLGKNSNINMDLAHIDALTIHALENEGHFIRAHIDGDSIPIFFATSEDDAKKVMELIDTAVDKARGLHSPEEELQEEVEEKEAKAEGYPGFRRP